jgi:methylmalonyl-CoA mutase
MQSAHDTTPYQPKHPIRIVTAGSLFDGHDAAINIMRRILLSTGVEVIHLGHNRSVGEIVDCAIQEDAQGIALTSYQGGHLEYFRYLYDLLQERGADIRIFGGGGGTILPSEIEALQAHGVNRIYHPDDGRNLGLQGMINEVVSGCDFARRGTESLASWETLDVSDPAGIAALITVAENHPKAYAEVRAAIRQRALERQVPILGITGTGGAGKSSLIDELLRRFVDANPLKRIAVISIDPSRKRSGGALFGDRIRMNSASSDRVFVRSLATRQSNLAMSAHVQDASDICRAAGFDALIVETSGIGQSDTQIIDHSDVSIYVMTAEYGASSQLEKIDMLDYADAVVINKFDKPGSLDARRDVLKQVRRNRKAFHVPDASLPVFGTIASQFADAETNRLFGMLMEKLSAVHGTQLDGLPEQEDGVAKPSLIPESRTRYLASIADTCDAYDRWVDNQCAQARAAGNLEGALELLDASSDAHGVLSNCLARESEKLDENCRKALGEWDTTRDRYAADLYRFEVRGKTLEQPLTRTSLSGTTIPRVAFPRLNDPGDRLRWLLQENVPGSFPYTAGVFPLKRQGEDPARMFAGEGGPERTNRRFHYVSRGLDAKRLSTAFDSVTLYGEDPAERPDIYGKIGNSGVSVCTLDDAKKLYSGFDLVNPKTSVSMTINGPAPVVLGFFLNAAIDQQVEKYLHATGQAEKAGAFIEAKYQKLGLPRPKYQGEIPEGNDGLGLLLLGASGDEVVDAKTYATIRAETLRQVRGTVQADILKEDQAQNTCIFSTEFALRLMGDIQAYFVEQNVRNFYSVSISGYHIAEAGANPISQLAFTLANGFTFVEYYLARGMDVNAFAPNLSFFFSNGLDPEYSVIGRVARRIWAKAMAKRYHADARAQKLKYHIQTSGRSLHAQEIAFNDIRTTLQALYALNDNCNSLHTNAYDEAITTPTEESVRRALAIQLVINKELGLSMNENPLQGSFFIEWLTDEVERAVLEEFRSLSARGDVLGAMERMYQRSKIQEESLHYETLKHTGELPIVGVNTFLDPSGSPTKIPDEVIRSTPEERNYAIASCEAFMARNQDAAHEALERLADAARDHENLFEQLMDATKVCSLGQLTGRMYRLGGQYRRNM